VASMALKCLKKSSKTRRLLHMSNIVIEKTELECLKILWGLGIEEE
jgi:hypothetical protein